MMKISVKRITVTALLITMEIVLSRFCSISTPIVKIGFGFVPIVLAAVLYGPFFAGAAAAIADFMGAVLFPIGAYFPGFTLTAALTGIIFGILFYNRTPQLRITVTAALLVTVVLQLGLDTLWLFYLSGYGAVALIPARIVKCVIMTPIQILLIQAIRSKLPVLLKKRETV